MSSFASFENRKATKISALALIATLISSFFVTSVIAPQTAQAVGGALTVQLKDSTASDGKYTVTSSTTWWQNSVNIPLESSRQLVAGEKLYVFDDVSGKFLAAYGTTQGSVKGVVISGMQSNIVAYVADDIPTPDTLKVTDLTGIEATSNKMPVYLQAWSTQLFAGNPCTINPFTQGDQTIVATFENCKNPGLYASYNQSIGASSTYGLYIFDNTDNKRVYYQAPGNEGNNGGNPTYYPKFYTGGPHTYTAYIAQGDANPYGGAQKVEDLVDIQATSNSIVVSRQKWDIFFSIPDLNANNDYALPSYQAQIVSSQNIGATNEEYAMYVVNSTTGDIIQNCYAKPVVDGYSTGGSWSPGDRAYGQYCNASIDMLTTAGYKGYIASAWTDSTKTTRPTREDQLQDIQVESSVISMEGLKPPSYYETYAGPNPSQNCSQACSADPINTFTGEYWDKVADITVNSGKGNPLGYVRSYTSGRANVQDPRLGYGWTDNYTMALSSPDDMTTGTLRDKTHITVRQENGSIVDFTSDGVGGYISSASTFAYLALTANGFEFTRDHKNFYVFDNNGKLISIRDRHGDVQTLTYATDGRLSRIANSTGNFLNFTYSPDGLLTQITDDSNRTVKYEYTAGSLTKVTGVSNDINQYTYNSDNRIVTMTNPLGGVTTNVYGSDGKVTEQTNPLGKRTTFAYGASCWYSVCSPYAIVTSPTGLVNYYSYNVDGQLSYERRSNIANGSNPLTTYYTYDKSNNVKLINADNIYTSMKYDGEGRMTSQTNADGSSYHYTYDDADNLTSITDPLGNVATMEYDADDNLIKATSFGGKSVTSSFDSFGRPLATVSARGNEPNANPADYTTTFTYNTQGYLSEVTDALGAKTKSTYDARGNVLTSTDPLGNKVSYTYDAADRLLSGADPTGKTVSTEYDVMGNPVVSRDQIGAPSIKTYDVAGNITQSNTPDGRSTKYFYDDGGNLQRTESYSADAALPPLVMTISRDRLGRVVSVTAPDGTVTSQTWNDQGYVATSTNTQGGVTSYLYDIFGKVVSSTNPDGGVSSFIYDGKGQLLSSTDPDGRVTTFEYNADGQLIHTNRNDETVVSATYDADGNQTSFIDGLNQSSHAVYDVLGRKTSYTDAVGKTTGYEYSVASQLKKLTNPDNSTVSYSYDTRGNNVTVDYSDPGTSDVQMTYDVRNQLTKMQSGTEQVDYTYDVVGKLLSRSSGTTDTVRYSYDGFGRKNSLEYPSGLKLNYAYDSSGRMTGVIRTDILPISLIAHYSYDTKGNVSRISYGNGTATNYSYDSSGRTTGFRLYDNEPNANTNSNTGLLYQSSTAYQSSGLQSGKTTNAGSDVSTQEATTYTYDPLARVDQVKINDTLKDDYNFDANSRLTTASFGAAQQYNAAGQVVSSTQNGVQTSFQYDVNGRRTSATTQNPLNVTHYTFDGKDQLTGVSLPQTGTTSAQSVDYGYTADGLLKSRTVTNSSASTSQNFVWDVNSDVELMLEDGKNEYIYAASNAPSVQIDKATGDTYYLQSDNLGSVVAVTDSARTLVANYTYDTYGNSSTDRVSAFGYAGEYQDKDTGLYYLRARWYEPKTGNFLSLDPMSQMTQDGYGYGSGNPVSLTDPTGMYSRGEVALAGKLLNGGAMAFAVLCTVATAGVCAGPAAAAAALAGATASTIDYAIKTECTSLGGYVKNASWGALENAPGFGQAAKAVRGAKEVKEIAAVEKAAVRSSDEAAETVGAVCSTKGNSFDAGTPVLMADGTTKPIEDVKVGDKVAATDPVTGKSAPKEVTQLIRHSGDHEMVVLTFSDGQKIDATDGHPFWNDAKKEWVVAKDLVTGDQVVTSTGEKLFITSIKTYTADLIAHNFTVADLHTYYIGNANSAILVHNSDNSCGLEKFISDNKKNWEYREGHDKEGTKKNPTIYAKATDANGNEYYGFSGWNNKIDRNENLDNWLPANKDIEFLENDNCAEACILNQILNDELDPTVFKFEAFSSNSVRSPRGPCEEVCQHWIGKEDGFPLPPKLGPPVP